ncbi:MAG: hypothetical protein QOJ64_3399 [Acidobacteriota bacterium]|jgi:hypothetical protein|nr:hypothetical protein [Acidobacteriota bacterium]
MRETFPMPGGSWAMIKKIVIAYGAARDDESPTVESIANLAGMPRPAVSKNNNFLRAVGLLESDTNKLTEAGSQFATGLGLRNDSIVAEALQGIIAETSQLNLLVKMLKARGTMTTDAFNGQVVLAMGLHADSPSLNYVRTLMDLLVESQLVKVTDEGVSLRSGAEVRTGKKREEGAEGGRLDPSLPSPPPPLSEHRGIPIALGVRRLAYLELPEDWQPKELPKLLKLIQLSLEEESSGD